MKKLLLFVALFVLAACQNKEKEKQKENEIKELQKQALEIKKNQIDFFINAKPKYFSAKTLDGKTFNSADHKGKNLLILIYDKSYLRKRESYDMVQELNELYHSYNDKIKCIGMIEGYVENQNELDGYMKSSGILFDQIDNTKSQNKPEILNHNLFCSPAKILIDTNGKVIHSSCGGGESNELIQKLDRIKKL